ncbi:MAG TPA: ABC transporter substrate-binding protein, partial [Anaerolineales bacterium]|nr:ABC transporter substrate-binding protein [Anaerolineales bacterium]
SGASIMDREWSIGHGGWAGDCQNWAAHYAPAPEDDPFSRLANGTGPYRLASWAAGESIQLERFDAYWRTLPAWPGGPAGPAQLERIELRITPDVDQRLAWLSAGEIDHADVPPPAYAQLEALVGEVCIPGDDLFRCEPAAENAPLRLFKDFPQAARRDVFFNFEVSVPEGGNPFLGSGVLDGDGIPPDFFSDVNIRRAFNYCFDRQAYREQALGGEAYSARGLLLPAMPGYEQSADGFSYNLDNCAQAFQRAAIQGPQGETVWEAGFRLQFLYPAEDLQRRLMGETLAVGLQALNPRFRLEVVAADWDLLTRSQRTNMLPLFTLGWMEDIHDPHHWADLYLAGAFARSQNMPPAQLYLFNELIDQGIETLEPERRAATYARLNELVFEQAPQILLPLPTGRRYEQRWVSGWYFNPALPGIYFYALSKR